MNLNAIRYTLNAKKGFTLMEVIVAIGVFSTIVAASTGIFISTLSAQRKAVALQNIQDNVRFALESTAKEIRTGKNFSVNPEGTQLNFTNAAGASVIYALNNGVLERSSDGGATYFPLTDGQNTEVAILKFYLQGEIEGDGFQPRVIISMRVRAKNVKIAEQSEMFLQTTISAREIQS